MHALFSTTHQGLLAWACGGLSAGVPAGLGCFPGDIGSCFRAELRCSRPASLRATEAPQGDGCRVLGRRLACARWFRCPARRTDGARRPDPRVGFRAPSLLQGRALRRRSQRSSVALELVAACVGAPYELDCSDPAFLAFDAAVVAPRRRPEILAPAVRALPRRGARPRVGTRSRRASCVCTAATPITLPVIDPEGIRPTCARSRHARLSSSIADARDRHRRSVRGCPIA